MPHGWRCRDGGGDERPFAAAERRVQERDRSVEGDHFQAGPPTKAGELNVDRYFYCDYLRLLSNDLII